MILGAVGQLQFEVVAFRLEDEYSVNCVFEGMNVFTARWVTGDERKLEEFRIKAYENLARRSRRAARVSRAVAREPAADARALAGPASSARRASRLKLRTSVARSGAAGQ